jgi:predicted DNA-binding protein YlxM (UPF0122 family)
MDILKTDYINSLLDIYAELLTPYQQEIMDLYYQEDLSLKEIADEKEISRNAVFTLINRVEKILINYEEKLHLLDKRRRIQDELDSETNIDVLKTKLESILDE